MTTDTQKVEITRDENGVKIVEYSATQSALARLESDYKGVVFDVATTKGMAEAKDARKRLRGLRTGLEKRRQELKAPILEYTRALDGQAKEITARITALEDPIDQQVKAEEQRKAREKAEAEAAERARIDAHRRVIEAMRNKPLELIGAKAVDLEVAFNEIQATDLSGLEEFAGEAALVKDEAAGKLHELWTQAMEREEAAAKEAEAQRQRDAKAAEERAAREAEQAELEELRAFKAKQQAKEAERQKADLAKQVTDDTQPERQPEPDWSGFDMASGPDTTVYQEAPKINTPARETSFDVHVEWSGYSRGVTTYRVMAATAEDAMERWSEGEMVERIVVRDDTEGEAVSSIASEIAQGGEVVL